MKYLRKLWRFLVPLRCGWCPFKSRSPQGMGRHRAKCRKVPREICGGSLTVAVDRQGEWMGTGAATTGECGLCHERVGIDNAGCCLVHPVPRPIVLDTPRKAAP